MRPDSVAVELYVSDCDNCNKRIYRYPDGFNPEGLGTRDGEWFHFDSYKNCMSGGSVNRAVPVAHNTQGILTGVTKETWDGWK